MAGQIAILNVPADGAGNPSLVIPDYARAKLYFISSAVLRSYNFALETQSPIVSSTAFTGTIFGADVDPVTGSLLINRAANGGGIANADPLFRFDPNTLLVTGSFGATTSFPNWPTSFWALQSVVCVGVGTLASGGAVQVGWAFMKESEFSGFVGVVRTDNMTQGGFHSAVVSGSVDNRGFMCRGASGAAGASAFLTWSTTSPAPLLPVYKVTILPGAETYNPASWPTTNPYISSATIGSIAAASVDATWTNLAASSIGYDQTDGNILMRVFTNDAVTTKNYLIKVNAVTAAVMWVTPLTADFRSIALAGSSVGNDVEGVLRPAVYSTVATDTGSPVAGGAIGGLTYGSVSINADPVAAAAFSDSLALYFARLAFNGAASGAPTPVAGTPSSFGTSFVILEGLLPAPPPASQLAELLDLWFAPTAAFVDLRAQSNRRKFIGLDASTQYLGANGERPFGAVPPIFLSLRDALSANHFADNEGSGGAFAITGGSLAAGSGRPPCGDYQAGVTPIANSPQGADPQIMLSISDNGGRTFSLLQKWRSMGKIGRYKQRLRWLKMGDFRQRQMRLEVTDPVRRNIIGVYVDVSQGLE